MISLMFLKIYYFEIVTSLTGIMEGFPVGLEMQEILLNVDGQRRSFETYVRNYEDYEIVHRWLYYYDCDMLVCALCDRFKMIASMLRVFYNHFPCEAPCKMEDFKHATIAVSSQDTICFACVNSIFIYLASSFDILSKIYVELRDYEKLDFSKYPKMVSRKVLLGSIVKTNSDITGTIFEKPSCVNAIVKYPKNPQLSSNTRLRVDL